MSALEGGFEAVLRLAPDKHGPGARVSALAQPGEVLVSSTVKDLTAGSGLVFEEAGERELKGVPDRWSLFPLGGSTGLTAADTELALQG